MLKRNLLLLLTAFIWGFDFVAQHVAMDSIGPAFFCFLRFMIAGTVLLIVNIFRKNKDDDKKYIKYGIIGGIILFFGSFFQQYGLIYIMPGKSGFISALYIIFVPILAIFVKKDNKPTLKLWIGVALALLGLYLLTYKGKALIEISDLITVLSALVYSIQILFLDRYAPDVDVYRFNTVEFYTAAVLSLLCMFVTKESFNFYMIKDCLWPLLYVGIIGTCVSYVTQTLGQIDNNPTIASLVMSLESVFAAISSYFILHDVLSTKELIGCAIIFVAIIFVQIPSKKKN